MSDSLPPDPARLRILARWLELQLAAVREALDEAERPRWWVQWTRRRQGEPKRGTLHREGCWRPGEPDLNLAEARAVLAEHGERIARCDVCRPPDRP
ncbi:DUF6233 domain-containing protein [Streptomyces sp. B6B3]|uniref:DUF6233 domain-containing protein n=1 Tax=Streptomyces sp. B6B3 TaxID=3153570 RepID=UPI00325C8FAB